MAKRLIVADLVLVLAAAGIECALALGAAHVGPEPGDDAPGASIAVPLGLWATVLGAPLAALAGRRLWSLGSMLAPAAALYLTAFFYTEDPYYAPARRRYSDGGAVEARWIYVVLAVAVVTGLLGVRRPRIGGALAAVWLLVTALTTLLAGDGH